MTNNHRGEKTIGITLLQNQNASFLSAVTLYSSSSYLWELLRRCCFCPFFASDWLLFLLFSLLCLYSFLFFLTFMAIPLLLHECFMLFSLSDAIFSYYIRMLYVLKRLLGQSSAERYFGLVCCSASYSSWM